MSDSTDRPKAGESQDSSVMTPESLKESLDELANNVDSLVDRLTMDMTDSPVEEEKQQPPKAPAEPPPVAAHETSATPQVTATPRGDGSLETDEELFDLAGEMIESLTNRTKTPLKPVAAPTRDPADDRRASERSALPWADESPVDSATEPTAETEITTQAPVETERLAEPGIEATPSDEGHEIDALADLMVDSLTLEPPVAGTEQPSAEGLEIDLAEETDSVPPVEEDPFAELAATDQPEAEETDEVTPAAEDAQPAETPVTTSAGATPWAASEVPIKRRRGNGRWMRVAAAGIMIGVAASVTWVMLGRRTSTIETTNRIATPPKTIESQVPVSVAIPVVTPETVQSQTSQTPDPSPVVPDPSPAPQQSARSTTAEPVEKPRSTPKPRAVMPKPRAEPVVAAKQPEPKPTRVFPPPPPPTKAAKVEPKPEPRSVEPSAVEPDPEPVAVAASSPEEPSVAKPIERLPAQAAPRPEPPAPPAEEAPAAPTTTPSTPPAEAGSTGPAVAGEIQPPELVSRQEAIYPEKSRKRGESGVVVLKVLVSEKGRVARVVIEQGIRGSELEARAIDAALRSVYRPATQDGREVRAWITERFVFEP